VPIIINEFEVVAEPPLRPPPTPAPEAPAPQPTAHDVEQAIEHQLERALRIWAT
jgi:hypothetical protein